MSVKPKLPEEIGKVTAVQMYFAKLDNANNALAAEYVIPSNYSTKDQAYLLNAAPGDRYVAVAVEFTTKNQNAIAFFPEDVIPQTEITVSADRMAFMGDFRVNELTILSEFDATQAHYYQLIAPDAPYTAKLRRFSNDPDAESEFWKRAQEKAFKEEPAWLDLVQASSSTLEKKYNPGHYIAMNRFDRQSDMISIATKPGVIGVQKRYYWKELEPAFDQYDFSVLEADLDLMASQGLQFVAFIEDKTFKDVIPTPPYLHGEYTIPNRRGGYTVKRWSPFVVDRFKLLVLELGKQLDSHRALEGIAIQESSLGLDDATLTIHSYTPEAYRDALVDLLVTSASALPESQVFWFMNFFPRKQSYIREIADIVRAEGVSMGGPDILPDNQALRRLTYPIYDDFKGKMTLFNSVQNGSYAHLHEDTSFPTEYWTMDELFKFAKDGLHVNYLFWNRKTWSGPDGSYLWTDALPVIGSNPDFNR